MFSCNVKSFVYYEHYPKEYVMEHSHNCFECVFYLNGCGKITVSNEVYGYFGPTISIVGPNIKHDETTEEFSKLFIVLFDVNNKKLFENYKLVKLTDEQSALFFDFFDKIQLEYKNRDRHYSTIINAYFEIFLTQFLRITNANDCHSNYEELIKQVKSYIKENYQRNIDFKVIAESYGYSYDRFRHIFAEEANISLNQYLLNCRIYEAKQLLLNTDYSIKEIAIRCGFKDTGYFIKYFSNKMNITPNKFRKLIDNQIDVGVLKITKK